MSSERVRCLLMADFSRAWVVADLFWPDGWECSLIWQYKSEHVEIAHSIHRGTYE
jgi:hypothetical protein